MARSKKQQSRKSKKGGTTTPAPAPTTAAEPAPTTVASASTPVKSASTPVKSASTTGASASTPGDYSKNKQDLNDRLSKITPGFSFFNLFSSEPQKAAVKSLEEAKTAVDAITDKTTYDAAVNLVETAEAAHKAANPTVGGKRKSKKSQKKSQKKSKRNNTKKGGRPFNKKENDALAKLNAAKATLDAAKDRNPNDPDAEEVISANRMVKDAVNEFETVLKENQYVEYTRELNSSLLRLVNSIPDKIDEKTIHNLVKPIEIINNYKSVRKTVA